MIKWLFSYLEEAVNPVANDFGDFIVGGVDVGGEATEHATNRRLVEEH